MTRKITPFLILLLLSACIDRFEFTSSESAGLLSVEGYLTTTVQKHRIRLSRAAEFGPGFVGQNNPERLATVFLKDDLGNFWQLTEASSGFYETTDDFAAELDRTYNLEIYTRSGGHYISLPERAVPVPELDSLSFRSVRTATANELIDEIGVEVWGHFQDPPDQKNYYYWKIDQAVYVFLAIPEECRNCRGEAPDCCDRCYRVDIRPTPSNVYTEVDDTFNGLYRNQVIAYILDDGKKFRETYRIDMSHMSVSPATHRFLKLVDQQLRLTGSVFDPPPANIRGNILSLNNPEETVLGQFFVADERKRRIYIDFDRLEFTRRPFAFYYNDCQLEPESSTQMPADWRLDRDP